MAFLVLDIETIPRPTIDESVEELIAQKTQARVERTGDDPENAESLIRSTSPFFGQVLCIGLRWLQDDGTSKDKVICEENEEATLNTFFNIINHSSSKNARYIHYNGLGFDEGNIEAVNEYVMRDVEATHHLFEKLRQYIN